MPLSNRRSFLVCGALFLRLVLSTATCYLPDGSVAYGDTPCGSSLPATCCAGQCLSNGLCFTPLDNMLARSSCTDQSWKSSVCTSYCKGSNTNAFEPISPCGGGLFCCGVGPGSGADECCSSGSGFSLSDGNLVASPVAPVTITIVSTQVVTNVVTIISTSVSLETVTGGVQTVPGAVQTAAAGLLTIVQTISKPITIISTVTVDTVANKPSPTNSEIFTVICTGPSGSETSSVSAALSSSCPSCSSKETAIGAGLGASLGLALLALLALLFWRKGRPSGSYQAPPAFTPAPVPVTQNNHTHFYPSGQAGLPNSNTQSQTTWQGNDGVYGSPRVDSPPMYRFGK